MELDQLNLSEIVLASRLIELLGYPDDVASTGRSIRVLEAVTYTYRRVLKEMDGDYA